MRLYPAVRPLLFRLDAERAHHAAMRAARWAQAAGRPVVRSVFGFEDERLAQQCWGLPFRNPLGLAAGFDKNAELAPFWEALGFGFVEVGSVSAQPAPGNPKPRAFRLPADEALVNRMGLNNDGAEAVAERLRRVVPRLRTPLGINIVKTHDPAILGEAAVEDFRRSFRRLAPLAGYVALNISCPNTTEGKTFERPEALDPLLTAVFDERAALGRAVPVLVKLSPPAHTGIDTGAVDALVDVARAHGVDGLIAVNTASDRSGLRTADSVVERIGRGGLSGVPLAARAEALVRYLYRATDGALPIVGVGGIDSAEAAYARIRSGASLLQLYTGLVYHGPGLVKRIKQGLVECLARDGFDRLADAVGVDA